MISIYRALGTGSHSTRTRLIASVTLGAALVVGTSGCAMLSPQGTTVQYSAADGINIPNLSGPLEVRNALVVANDSGTEGNLVAAIVNPTDHAAVLNIQVGEGSAAVSKSVRVPAGATKSLGSEDTPPLLIQGLNALPGSTVSIYFQSGDGDGSRTDVPVLDGSLEYLAPLVP